MITPGLAAAEAVTTEDEVDGEGPFEHLDAGGQRRLVERALHLGTAAVSTGVHDAVVAVAALAGERRVAAARCRRVERRTEALQVADRLGCLGDQLAHDGLVAQPGTGGEGVAHVVVERVRRVEHAGEPTLGPCRRPGTQGSLGDHQHLPDRAGGKGGGESGGSGADHDHVDAALPRGCRNGERPRPVVIHRGVVLLGGRRGGADL